MLNTLRKISIPICCWVIAVALIGVPKAEAQHSPSDILFGVANINDANTLVIVDPATGTLTPVGNFPGLTGVIQGVSALDAANQRYFFPMAGRLFVVNIQTGDVITNPLLPTTATGSVIGPSSMEFDPTTDTLFGVANLNNANTLVTVDPVTAAFNPVGNFPGLTGVIQGVSALDAANQRYLFPMAGRLFVVNIQTGDVIANPLLPTTPGGSVISPGSLYASETPSNASCSTPLKVRGGLIPSSS